MVQHLVNMNKCHGRTKYMNERGKREEKIEQDIINCCFGFGFVFELEINRMRFCAFWICSSLFFLEGGFVFIVSFFKRDSL